jgi:hypothetical protein
MPPDGGEQRRIDLVDVAASSSQSDCDFMPSGYDRE